MVDITSNKWKEECGVFGVFSRTEDVSMLTYLGLYALQHRGQESAGIAVTDGAWMDVTRDMGLVNEVFQSSITSYGKSIYCYWSCTLFNNWL